MPTKNPRLSVVLPPGVAATLAALSVETGESSSSLVRGLLEHTAPALERMLQLVIAAKAAKGQISSGVSNTLDRVVDDLHDALAVADARASRALGDLVSQAQEVKGRRRSPGATRAAGPAGGASVSSTPRPVTRGVGSGKTRRSIVKGL
jgi:predicted DNA-binding protein